MIESGRFRMTFLADAYRDVDAAGDIAKLSTCLDRMEDLPDFRAYKDASYAVLGLAPDGAVADIACGLGHDLKRLRQRVPRGSVTGFDASAAFVAEAQRRIGEDPSVSVLVGDAGRLDAEASSFDAARIDRSLQHIPDPAGVIAEMVRIVRTGGIVSAAEPDWRSFVIGSGLPGTADSVAGAFAEGFRNPLVGRALVGLIGQDLEITHHSVHPVLLRRLADAEVIFDLTETVDRCVETGRFDADEGAAFVQDLARRDAAGTFFALLNLHLVAGRKGGA